MEKIIAQCKKGDREAFAQLYRAYSPRMMKVIRLYVHDRVAAQDILHDGFLVVFSQIKSLDDTSRIDGWMATIMRNISLQYLKNIDVEAALSDNFDYPEVPEIGSIITMEEIEAIINCLPEGYQKVFRLAVFDGLSHKEIGQRLGIAPKTSASQLAHAKAMLRDLIQQHYAKAGILALLLLLATPIVYLLLNNQDYSLQDAAQIAKTTEIPANQAKADVAPQKEEKPSVVIEKTAAAPVAYDIVAKQQPTEATWSATVATADSIAKDNLAVENAAARLDSVPKAANDSVKAKSVVEQSPFKDYYALNMPRKKKSHGGVSVSVGGISSGINMAANEDYADGGSAGDHYAPDPYPGVLLESETVHHQPIEVSVRFQHIIAPNLSLDYGVSYTYRHTDVKTKYALQYVEKNYKSHFIGIPLKVNYRFINSGKFNMYGTGGVWVDFPIHSKMHKFTQMKYPVGESETDTDFKLPVQWSLTGGIGLEYKITPRVSIFAEPSARYFLNHDSNSAILNEERVEFSLPIGIRFNL